MMSDYASLRLWASYAIQLHPDLDVSVDELKARLQKVKTPKTAKLAVPRASEKAAVEGGEVKARATHAKDLPRKAKR